MGEVVLFNFIILIIGMIFDGGNNLLFGGFGVKLILFMGVFGSGEFLSVVFGIVELKFLRKCLVKKKSRNSDSG